MSVEESFYLRLPHWFFSLLFSSLLLSFSYRSPAYTTLASAIASIDRLNGFLGIDQIMHMLDYTQVVEQGPGVRREVVFSLCRADTNGAYPVDTVMPPTGPAAPIPDQSSSTKASH